MSRSQGDRVNTRCEEKNFLFHLSVKSNLHRLEYYFLLILEGQERDQGAKSFYSQQIFTQYSVKYQQARGTA